jgi:hypothetical protein
MVVVRYGLPVALVVAGLVCLAALPDSSRTEGWAGFTGAGIAVLLLNVLYRVGVSGDAERDREDAARSHFAEHGEWPEEDESPRRRRWNLPEGIATPESEAADRVRSDDD